MASESSDREVASGGLPDELDGWLDQRADRLGVSREELLAGLVGSYRLVADAEADDVGAALGGTAPPTDVDDRIEATVEERIGRLERQVGERIETLEAEVEEAIDEIRKRVVELKNQVDAAADHDHEAFERIDDLADELDRLEATVASVRNADGADADEIEALDERLRKVASAVVALREGEVDGGRKRVRREALSELKRQAGRMGVESAECDACGNEVNLALLTEPACPYCETELREVTDASGWLFGGATVGPDDGTTGDAR